MDVDSSLIIDLECVIKENGTERFIGKSFILSDVELHGRRWIHIGEDVIKKMASLTGSSPAKLLARGVAKITVTGLDVSKGQGLKSVDVTMEQKAISVLIAFNRYAQNLRSLTVYINAEDNVSSVISAEVVLTSDTTPASNPWGCLGSARRVVSETTFKLSNHQDWRNLMPADDTRKHLTPPNISAAFDAVLSEVFEPLSVLFSECTVLNPNSDAYNLVMSFAEFLNIFLPWSSKITPFIHRNGRDPFLRVFKIFFLIPDKISVGQWPVSVESAFSDYAMTNYYLHGKTKRGGGNISQEVFMKIKDAGSRLLKVLVEATTTTSKTASWPGYIQGAIEVITTTVVNRIMELQRLNKNQATVNAKILAAANFDSGGNHKFADIGSGSKYGGKLILFKTCSVDPNSDVDIPSCYDAIHNALLKLEDYDFISTETFIEEFSDRMAKSRFYDRDIMNFGASCFVYKFHPGGNHPTLFFIVKVPIEVFVEITDRTSLDTQSDHYNKLDIVKDRIWETIPRILPRIVSREVKYLVSTLATPLNKGTIYHFNSIPSDIGYDTTYITH